MNTTYGLQSNRWASLAIIAGGLLMIALWLVFTSVHGPTSFDQDHLILGRGTLFWGRWLGGLPNLFVALGLLTLLPLGTSRQARIGYILTMIGLVVPALLDLIVWSALGPPFFLPVVGIGLILWAFANRQNAQIKNGGLVLLTLVGIFELIAFALALLPNETADQFGGYRIHGLFAHLITGLGWIAFGVGLWKNRT